MPPHTGRHCFAKRLPSRAHVQAKDFKKLLPLLAHMEDEGGLSFKLILITRSPHTLTHIYSRMFTLTHTIIHYIELCIYLVLETVSLVFFCNLVPRQETRLVRPALLYPTHVSYKFSFSSLCFRACLHGFPFSAGLPTSVCTLGRA